jgi:glucokinase
VTGPPVVGIDIGGTNMQVGVVDPTNRISGRAARRTAPERGLDAVIETLADGVGEACAEAGLAIGDVGAVGIAAAGAMDIPAGVVLDAPNLRWYDVPLRDLVRDRLQRPVVLENDVNGAAWGEHRLGAGAGAGARDALGVWIGTGIGGGLILDDRIHHGAYFTAGEIGQTIVAPDADRWRTLEERASRSGMRRLIDTALPDRPDCVLHETIGGDASRLGTDELVRAYDAGDALVRSVVDRGADLIGIAIADTVTMLALDTVYVGGGITEAMGAPYVERINASFRANVFPDRCRACRFLVTKLAADAGLLGAALIARGA